MRPKLAHDYVRDPLDHIDFEIRANDFLAEIRNSTVGGRYHPSPAYSLPLAKGKGISRPTVSLDLVDLLVYRVLIELLESRLMGKIPPTAFHGGRMLPNAAITDFYERWWENWSKYQVYLKRLKRRGYNTFVVTDIAAYFEQIDLHLLRDMVAHECPGKKRLVDLLFYLLESKTPRNFYARNIYRGLPQENFDCSRELGTFFLHPVDSNLQQWCRQNGARYARWVDDFNIAVRHRSAAKAALGQFTEYLRQLHLSASVEKTLILHGREVNEHFYFRENQKLDRIQRLLAKNRRRDAALAKQVMRQEYAKFRRKSGGNWKKVLKRFYTGFAMIRSRRLVGESYGHLIQCPDLAQKILDYLAAQRFDPRILQLIHKYLRSDENLYAGVESEILEFLMVWPIRPKARYRGLIAEIGKTVLFRRRYRPKSEYARGLSALLAYKFGSVADLTEVADHYLESAETDPLLRKYLVAVSLTSPTGDQAERVLQKARLDPAPSVKRLVEFVDYLRTRPRLPDQIVDKIQRVPIKFSRVPTLPIRKLLLANFVFKYSPNANRLRARMQALRGSLKDPFVVAKIDSFI